MTHRPTRRACLLLAMTALLASACISSNTAPTDTPTESTAPDAPAPPPTAPEPPSTHDHQSVFDLAQRPWRPRYPLDVVSRQAVRDDRGKLLCPELETDVWRGEALKYQKGGVKVNEHFQSHLARFEAVAVEVATEVYGRAPTRVLHMGTYNCRTIRKRRYRLSEHAFGNAIDVAGFAFGALPKSEREGLTTPRAGRAFTVSVLKHWDSEAGFAALHSRFLKTLVVRLMDDDVFRGMIVPPAPGHKNHLHLDMGRWSYLRGDVSMPLIEEEEGEAARGDS